MDGHKNPAFPNTTLVAFGLIFRDAESNQGTREPADGAAHADARQCGHDWASRDERAQARNRQSANAHEPAQRATEDSA